MNTALPASARGAARVHLRPTLQGVREGESAARRREGLEAAA